MTAIALKDNIRYRNLTVSGLTCGGSTTLSLSLQKELGWTYRNSGEIYRNFIKENSLKLEHTTTSPDDIHRQIDTYVREHLIDQEHQIFEGWLTGFMAQGAKATLKVLLYCSNIETSVERLANREGISRETARKQMLLREKENLFKWQNLYGKVDFWNIKYFDLAIDTGQNNKEEVFNLVLSKLYSGKSET